MDTITANLALASMGGPDDAPALPNHEERDALREQLVSLAARLKTAYRGHRKTELRREFDALLQRAGGLEAVLSEWQADLDRGRRSVGRPPHVRAQFRRLIVSRAQVMRQKARRRGPGRYPARRLA